MDNVLSYVLTDHLGSSTVTLDDGGGIDGELRYGAYGETRASSGSMPTERLYSGQLGQNNIGLYYYNARWYAPYLNRWIQPDTLVLGAGNPQSMNRFSYNLGNPIRYVDPTGHGVDCGMGDRYCRNGIFEIPVTKPDGNCRSAANCLDQEDSYLTYKSLVYKLGRFPTMVEVVRMTVGNEYWSVVDFDTTPSPSSMTIKSAGGEAVARNYYEQCGEDGCQPTDSDLYRFMAGYEPWLGHTEVFDGDQDQRAQDLVDSLTASFGNTSDDLDIHVQELLGEVGIARGYTTGYADNRPWQFWGPTTTAPSAMTFGFLDTDTAILAVDMGAGSWSYFLTGAQNLDFTGR
jgi:RHS repeat-associated protein